MLYQLTAPKLRHPPTEGAASASFDTSDPQYRAYLKSLTEKGFFENEVVGSEAWREKEQLAREGWLRAKADRSVIGSTCPGGVPGGPWVHLF